MILDRLTNKKMAMKKLILIITVVMSGLLLQAQEMYLKKVTKNNNVSNYYYDENWKLDSVTYNTQTAIYQNDTIIKRLNPVIGDWEYTYENGLIIVSIEANPTYMLFYINDENQVYQKIGVTGLITDCIWEGDNLITTERIDDYNSTFTYHDDVSNPFYNENKFSKGAWTPYGSWTGSYDMIKTHTNPSVEITFTINDTLNGYPLSATSMGSGTFNYTFEYYIVTGTPELPAEKEKSISISYFNLMGQEIEKPKQGFYIERKLTSIGYVSNKYFIP